MQHGSVYTHCFPARKEDGSLDLRNYVFPAHRQIDFSDGPMTVYWCTCSPEQLSTRTTWCQLSTIHAMAWRKEDASAVLKDCVHIEALKVCA